MPGSLPCVTTLRLCLSSLVEASPWLRHSSLCHAFAIHRLSRPRPSCHFPAMPLLCQPCPCLRTTMPTLLCNTVADQNLAMPSHTIYAPYASAHRIGVHPCCAIANQNYAIAWQNLSLPCLCNAYPRYAHCNSVESYAFAILCLAPFRCAIALNLCAFP